MTLRPHVEQALEEIRARQQELYDALEPFRRAWRELPGDAQVVHQHLADRGWYLPAGKLPIGAFSQLRELIRQARDDEIESSVQQFAKSQIERVIQGVKQYHPHRHAIVADAVEAHRTAKYTLSIPALLAQADGLCYDALGESLFKRRAKRALGRLLQKCTVLGTMVPLGHVNEVLLNPLRMESSLVTSTGTMRKRRQSDPSYGPLNRNSVLHGLDVKYATEANSLRAILLIDYLLEVRVILVGHQEWVEDIKRMMGET